MKKEKRLKKFNISNRLAYTLMVILSIALLGIGVWAAAPNPGHSANELELDWVKRVFVKVLQILVILILRVRVLPKRDVLWGW